MERIVCIVGQLNVEIQSRELDGQTGRKRLIYDTRIVLGGRAFRQSIHGKALGLNIMLLGRVGRDDHGRMIRESLTRAGISVKYLEEAEDEHTGISMEIITGGFGGRRSFFDPGANLGKGDFKVPIDDYLHLCDAIIVNKWCHSDLRRTILKAAEAHGIPSIYVHSGYHCHEEQDLPMDFLFLDYTDEDDCDLILPKREGYDIKKGVFLFKPGGLHSLDAKGEELYHLTLAPELDADYLVCRLAAILLPAMKPDETARMEELLA